MSVQQPRLVGWLLARHPRALNICLQRRNKSSIVIGSFLASDSKNGVPGQMLRLKICRTASMLVLMFCLCERSISIVPRRLPIGPENYPQSLEVGGETMRGPALVERRGEHVVQPFADGANGGSFGRFLPTCRIARVRAFLMESSVHGRVCSCVLTLHVPGIAPATPGYIDFGSGLEFATWPLEC
ncbi:hypothetical protein CK203_087032 [Vitis vinifera]|uniref:Uncharacterized protein n=1 Tax=Vitis vinifera TaxID=29760 RepID=A0A438CLS2_VITVI|nr:hypothetical protein CK203_087032 [Vitis vinifera]